MCADGMIMWIIITSDSVIRFSWAWRRCSLASVVLVWGGDISGSCVVAVYRMYPCGGCGGR